MTLQPHNVVVLEEVSLTLDGKEYSTACDSVTLTPTTTKKVWTPVNGKTITRTPKPKWELGLNLGQDFDTTGLQHALIDGHGSTVPFILKPLGASDAAEITGSVTLEAVQVGGTGEEVGTAAVTLGVSGQPVFVWSAAG